AVYQSNDETLESSIEGVAVEDEKKETRNS
ncbi:hypothetical protein J2S15_004098, partial [Breznakia pachnodae]|nr:hypothetical protein [Breznakia pachnodae]